MTGSGRLTYDATMRRDTFENEFIYYMLIRGGENIQPLQVEAAFREHPGVIDSAVVGAPDPKWGQAVVAYIEARNPAFTAQDLDRFLVEHPMPANYKRPRYYRFMDALPTTATGKKMRFRVRQRVQADAEAALLTTA